MKAGPWTSRVIIWTLWFGEGLDGERRWTMEKRLRGVRRPLDILLRRVRFRSVLSSPFGSIMTHTYPHPELRCNPDDPSAQPVLICKIRKGQELRVRCIAKKVNFLSLYLPLGDTTHTHKKKTLWRSFICDCSTLGHSEGARKVVSMFRCLIRI
jgi:hypothetical protein